jgi:Zn-dependent protease
MVFITVTELVQMAILTVALGYIFSGFIMVRKDPYAPRQFFDWESIKFAALISTPAVIFHELAHKFVALGLGLEATFHIWTTGLLIGVVLKAISSPFLFLAPAYVTIVGATASYQTFLTAFAGPLANLVLFGISYYVLKTKKRISRKEHLGWTISKKLNLFLFGFNLIPIPPLDGFKVFTSFFGMF